MPATLAAASSSSAARSAILNTRARAHAITPPPLLPTPAEECLKALHRPAGTVATNDSVTTTHATALPSTRASDAVAAASAVLDARTFAYPSRDDVALAAAGDTGARTRQFLRASDDNVSVDSFSDAHDLDARVAAALHAARRAVCE
jgi:hypothetical protein